MVEGKSDLDIAKIVIKTYTFESDLYKELN